MTIQRILMPTDCSPGSAAAAETAAQMAADLHAAIDVVTVVDTSALEEAYGDVDFRTQRINEVRGIASKHAARFAGRHFTGVPNVAVHVRDGNTFLEIVQAARDLHSDMIIMGTHGRTGIAHLIIGSIAEKVVRASTIPVMTVRAPV